MLQKLAKLNGISDLKSYSQGLGYYINPIKNNNIKRIKYNLNLISEHFDIFTIDSDPIHLAAIYKLINEI